MHGVVAVFHEHAAPIAELHADDHRPVGTQAVNILPPALRQRRRVSVPRLDLALFKMDMDGMVPARPALQSPFFTVPYPGLRRDAAVIRLQVPPVSSRGARLLPPELLSVSMPQPADVPGVGCDGIVLVLGTVILELERAPAYDVRQRGIGDQHDALSVAGKSTLWSACGGGPIMTKRRIRPTPGSHDVPSVACATLSTGPGNFPSTICCRFTRSTVVPAL